MAFRLDEGLIFLSDTRTNAGVDNVGTYRKLHVLRAGDDRLFVLQSAGSLATTHEVLDRINADLATPGDHESLATITHLHEAAIYIGRLGREVTQRHFSALGSSATATFIVGGQIAGERADLFLVYPEGNYIRVSDERPFLQIGESKYGKFMLELAVHAQVRLEGRDQDRAQFNGQHRSRQSLRRTAIRPRCVSQRSAGVDRNASRGRLAIPRIPDQGVDDAFPRCHRPVAPAPPSMTGDELRRR